MRKKEGSVVGKAHKVTPCLEGNEDVGIDISVIFTPGLGKESIPPGCPVASVPS
jgi:hypothetical protein